MIKKIILLNLILITQLTYSQTNIGLTAGLKLLNFKTDAISINGTKPGFEIGAFLQLESGVKSDVFIEAAYGDNGIIFDANDPNNADSEVTTKYNFTEFRASILYSYFVKTPLIAIQIGPTATMQKINLADFDEQSFEIQNYKFNEQDLTNLPSFNLFATIGVSVGNEKLRGNLRYYYGFSNMLRELQSSHQDYNNNSGLYTGPDDFESKQSFLTLSVAYTIGD